MNRIVIDFNKTKGSIKPFHGINNAPITGASTRLYHYLKDAGIPYSRLHDTGGTYDERFVDINRIFRNFDADPEDPASYDFAFTDWLLEKITVQGTEIIYRLGVSIEPSHSIRALHIYPPKDFLKWAKICEGIIKHYNYGWADGYHYNIKYWEIWNEPDNDPEIEKNNMWLGTKEQYFELYKVAANYLKGKFPEIKIGGYGSCGFYAFYDAFAIDANSSSRTEYFIEFFEAFMEYISSEENKAPLDFFSWHTYDFSKNNYKSAKYVRDQLDKYGFKNAESMLNEWSPGVGSRGKEEDGSYVLYMMLIMHDSPLEIMTYYDGQVNGSYNGLFAPIGDSEIYPAYYALHSYNELYQLKNEPYTEKDEEAMPILAACDGNVGKVLIANKEETPLELDITISDNWKAEKLRIIDGVKGLLEVPFESGVKFNIPPKKIAMIEYKKCY